MERKERKKDKEYEKTKNCTENVAANVHSRRDARPAVCGVGGLQQGWRDDRLHHRDHLLSG
jgi:hypothetical protein